MDEQLYSVLDYILNHAENREIEVILEAVKKRYERRESSGGMGLSAEDMARETAQQINDQIGLSREQIRGTVRNLAAEIIRKNAPELEESQMKELLKAWVPDPKEAKPRFAPVPRDALKVMVDQFLRYSGGTMSATEQMRLEHEIPRWTERYWERFPGELRKIIGLYLKSALSEADFREGLKECFNEAPQES